MKPLGLYIHIPFCVKKCDYCDFLSFGGVPQRTKDIYVECLCSEIKDYGLRFEGQTLSTIYIGGGTPSVLSKDNFNRIMKTVHQFFTVDDKAEVTMEMNPGTVTEDKLSAYVAAGINRVSMGLQSDDDDQLVSLGRIHTYQDFRETYDRIRKAGIDNISIDVMFGLSGQTMAQWQRTLENVIDMNPEHISAYSLIIEEGTPYETLESQGLLSLPDEDTERAMFWYAHERLNGAGYDHYEISNYAKEGMASKHNSSYWELIPYIGVGLGASSFYDERRYRNVTSMDAYLREGGHPDRIRLLEQTNDSRISLEERFFLGLRKLQGINMNALVSEYGKASVDLYSAVIEAQIEKGLLEKVGPYLKLTSRGVDISNQVMAEFILED